MMRQSPLQLVMCVRVCLPLCACVRACVRAFASDCVHVQDKFAVTPEAALQAVESRFFRVLVSNINKVIRTSRKARSVISLNFYFLCPQSLTFQCSCQGYQLSILEVVSCATHRTPISCCRLLCNSVYCLPLY